MASKPLIIVEDDFDDQALLKELTEQLNPGIKILIFEQGEPVLDYLRKTSDQPFLIMCDVNMPRMNGLELRREIVRDEFLRKKSIPFIFVSTSARQAEVDTAYDLVVQGYFEKGTSYEDLKTKLKLIFDYWENCKHPNSF